MKIMLQELEIARLAKQDAEKAITKALLALEPVRQTLISFIPQTYNLPYIQPMRNATVNDIEVLNDKLDEIKLEVSKKRANSDQVVFVLQKDGLFFKQSDPSMFYPMEVDARPHQLLLFFLQKERVCTSKEICTHFNWKYKDFKEVYEDLNARAINKFKLGNKKIDRLIISDKGYKINPKYFITVL